jgi:hypothetical protein
LIIAVTPDGRHVVLARDSIVVWDQETGDVRTGAANRAATRAFSGDRRVGGGHDLEHLPDELGGTGPIQLGTSPRRALGGALQPTMLAD